MPPNETSQPVADAVCLGENRPAIQQSLDVFAELSRGGVAPLGFWLERLQHDPVRVTLQAATETRRIRAPRVANLRQGRYVVFVVRLQPPPNGEAWCQMPVARLPSDPCGRLLTHRPASGQQLVEDRSEDVHVRSGRDGLTPQLFGCGVRRRQRPKLGRRLIGERVIHFEQLGDAEVEELHLASPRHEDVRRLQIPMDDERLMCVLRRVGHGSKEAEALFNRQALRIAVQSSLDSRRRPPSPDTPSLRASPRRRAAGRCWDVRVARGCALPP